RETHREVLTSGRVSIEPFENTQLQLHPVRSRRKFDLLARNMGNAPVTYTLDGSDDEDAFEYRFKDTALVLEPGEERRTPLEVQAKNRHILGRTVTMPFQVLAKPVAEGGEAAVGGQLISRPPMQRFVFPAIVLVLIAAAVLGALAYFFWPVWPFDDSRS